MGRLCVRRRADCGKAVREYVVGLYKRPAPAVKCEVPVTLAVTSFLGAEVKSQASGLEPFRPGIDLVVECAEGPDLACLKPYEFVRIVDLSVSVQAGEIAAILLVQRILEPERDNILKEIVLVLLGEFFEGGAVAPPSHPRDPGLPGREGGA